MNCNDTTSRTYRLFLEKVIISANYPHHEKNADTEFVITMEHGFSKQSMMIMLCLSFLTYFLSIHNSILSLLQKSQEKISYGKVTH